MAEVKLNKSFISFSRARVSLCLHPGLLHDLLLSSLGLLSKCFAVPTVRPAYIYVCLYCSLGSAWEGE